jgi:HSP20 family molecular chaperone IbpA
MTPRGEVEKYVSRASLPGIDPKHVQISVQAEYADHRRRAQSGTQDEARYFHEEFSYGEFERTPELPEGVNTEESTPNS